MQHSYNRSVVGVASLFVQVGRCHESRIGVGEFCFVVRGADGSSTSIPNKEQRTAREITHRRPSRRKRARAQRSLVTAGKSRPSDKEQ